MPNSGADFEQVLRHVRARVYEITNDGQRPWTNSGLIAEFHLVPLS